MLQVHILSMAATAKYGAQEYGLLLYKEWEEERDPTKDDIPDRWYDQMTEAIRSFEQEHDYPEAPIRFEWMHYWDEIRTELY